MAEYEALLATHGTDCRNVSTHRVDTETRERLFGSDRGKFHWLPNEQRNGEVILHYRTQVYHGPLCRRREMV